MDDDGEQREFDRSWLYSLGWDSSTAEHAGADANAGVIAGVMPLLGMPEASVRRLVTVWEPVPDNGAAQVPFRVVIPWAMDFVGRDPHEKAEIIHRTDQLFGFSILMMDSQGGGSEVYKYLRRPLEGSCAFGRGLATAADQAAGYPHARPIVHGFNQAGLIEVLPPEMLGAVDRIRFGAMGMVRELFRGRRVRFCPPLDFFQKRRIPLTEGQAGAAAAVTKMRRQFKSIYAEMDTRKDPPEPKRTAQGAMVFNCRGKKDIAMTGIYAMMGAMILIKRWVAEFAAGGGDEGW